jgi:hypothetical protein
MRVSRLDNAGKAYEPLRSSESNVHTWLHATPLGGGQVLSLTLAVVVIRAFGLCYVHGRLGGV